MVDIETGEEPRAMRPPAADSEPRSAGQPRRSTARDDRVKQPAAHRSHQAKPTGETPVEPGRIEPDASANQRQAPDLPIDDKAVTDHTFVAGPDPSTPPFGTADVLWAEDWQADVSPAAPAGDPDAKPRLWRRGLRG